VPANLASVFNSSTNAIDLSWTAATDNVGVTGYEVFRDGAATAIATTTGTIFSDSGLAPDSTHSYAVVAVDAAGNRSALSNTASATTSSAPADVTAPSAPADLTAAVNVDARVISLSWTASTDDVGVTGYRVFRDNGTTPISTVTGTTFSDVNQLGTHSYVVAAIDGAGNQSGFSNTVLATIAVPEQVLLASLTLSPARVIAPASSTGAVTLSGAAPAGGVSVTLRSSETRKATVPATVTVPEGATSATFVIATLTGSLGGGENQVTISATLGVTRSATLTILRP
jgi:chitodextrinase